MSKSVNDRVDEYLDAIRESGAINMFGAAPYLRDEFGFGKAESRAQLKRWMKEYK